MTLTEKTNCIKTTVPEVKLEGLQKTEDRVYCMAKKNAVRSMTITIVMMLVSCVLFIGSTLAWFTESVSSSSNIIQAGNLSGEVLVGGVENAEISFTRIDSTTSQAWEPGAIFLSKEITVKNDGNIDFQYNVLLASTDTSCSNVYYYVLYTQQSNNTETCKYINDNLIHFKNSIDLTNLNIGMSQSFYIVAKVTSDAVLGSNINSLVLKVHMKQSSIDTGFYADSNKTGPSTSIANFSNLTYTTSAAVDKNNDGYVNLEFAADGNGITKCYFEVKVGNNTYYTETFNKNADSTTFRGEYKIKSDYSTDTINVTPCYGETIANSDTSISKIFHVEKATLKSPAVASISTQQSVDNRGIADSQDNNQNSEQDTSETQENNQNSEQDASGVQEENNLISEHDSSSSDSTTSQQTENTGEE